MPAAEACRPPPCPRAVNNRFWCGGSLGGPNTCQASCSTLQYDPKANARCAAKVWKAGPSGGSNYGYWSVAHKFYTRSGCPCGV